MADLGKLESELKRFGDSVIEAVATVQTRTAVNVAIAVAGETPVDTSIAQSNWQLSEHKEGGRYFFDPPVRDVRHGYKRGPAYNKVIRDVKRKAERLDKSKALVRGTRIRPIYIQNLTPYIEELNKGKSTQAPAGFIEKSASKEFRRQNRDFDKFVVDQLRDIHG